MKPLARLLILPLMAPTVCAVGYGPPGLEIVGTEYVLTAENSPLEVAFVYITRGGTLRLEPGSHLIVDGYSDWLGVEIEDGRLLSEGTAEDPVRIQYRAGRLNLRIWSEYSPALPMLYLDHTYFDMGEGALVMETHQAEALATPLVEVRNSILTSTAHPIDYSPAMIALSAFNARIIFEDTLFLSSNLASVSVHYGKSPIEFRRCVFSTGPFIRPISALRIERLPFSDWSWIAGNITVEECRFSGFESAIRLGSHTPEWQSPLHLTIRRSDFSGTERMLRAKSTAEMLVLSVEDSHLMPSHFETTAIANAQLDFSGNFLPDGLEYTNVPALTTVTDPLAASPFRGADLNGDGIVNYHDIRLLQEFLLGHLDSEDFDEPDLLDVDGNGDVNLRDLAILAAYAEGRLLFLPEVPTP